MVNLYHNKGLDYTDMRNIKNKKITGTILGVLFVLTISFTLFGCGLKYNAKFYDNAADWIVEK